MIKLVWLSLSLVVFASCGGDQNNNPQLVVETREGEIVRGALAENLQIRTSIANRNINITLGVLDIYKISLAEPPAAGIVHITTTTYPEAGWIGLGEEITGVILNQDIVLFVGQDEVRVPTISITKLKMEW